MPATTRRHCLASLLGAGLTLVACSDKPPEPELQYSSAPQPGAVRTYTLVPHPLYNPQRLSAALQPLVDHLNSQLVDGRVELESSRDYQAFEQKFRNRDPDILLPNPWQTLEAMKVGYRVVAMWGDPHDFRGLFIVRRDSPIRTPQDLKGKTVSYPSSTALAAAVMPQYYLHQHGVDIDSDTTNLYVGSQESSIMNVYLGAVAAGATWPPPWRLFQKDHPAEAAQLRVIWETPSLVNNSVMVRDDLPAEVRQVLQQTLLALHQSATGQTILANMETARFYPANDSSYDVVRDYVAGFEKDVRLVEAP